MSRRAGVAIVLAVPDAVAESAATDAAPASPWRAPRKVHVRRGGTVTAVGIVYILMMALLGLAAMNSQVNLLFAVFGLMIGALLVSGVVSRLILRRLDLRREMPEVAEVGRRTRIVYRVRNRKRFWPTLSVTISELDAGGAGDRLDRQPTAYLLHAPPGGEASATAEITPLARGWIRFDRHQLTTSFPFGFVRRSLTRRRLPDRLLVHPASGAVEPTSVLRFLSAESSGLAQRPRSGGNDEIFGARDYQPGDPPRTIHWRRSARTLMLRSPDRPHGSLVVRQMTRVSPPRLVVLVDTFVPPEAAGLAGEVRRRRLGQVERNLAVAYNLLGAMLGRGLSVGMLVFDPDLPPKNGESPGGWREFRAGRGKRHRRDLAAVLAALRPQETKNPAALIDRGRPLVTGDTTGVLITAGEGLELNGDADRPSARRVGRGNFVTIRTAGNDLDRWVTFDPTLDWEAMADRTI